MNLLRTNRIVYIISLTIGSLVYWIIIGAYINSAYAITLSVLGYIICMLFLVTKFNEYAINTDTTVMEKYYDNALSICPRCGDVHICIFYKTFYSKRIMHILDLFSRYPNNGSVQIVTLAKCNDCKHIWYGGYHSYNDKRAMEDNA